MISWMIKARRYENGRIESANRKDGISPKTVVEHDPANEQGFRFAYY